MSSFTNFTNVALSTIKKYSDTWDLKTSSYNGIRFAIYKQGMLDQLIDGDLSGVLDNLTDTVKAYIPSYFSNNINSSEFIDSEVLNHGTVALLSETMQSSSATIVKFKRAGGDGEIAESFGANGTYFKFRVIISGKDFQRRVDIIDKHLSVDNNYTSNNFRVLYHPTKGRIDNVYFEKMTQVYSANIKFGAVYELDFYTPTPLSMIGNTKAVSTLNTILNSISTIAGAISQVISTYNTLATMFQSVFGTATPPQTQSNIKKFQNNTADVINNFETNANQLLSNIQYTVNNDNTPVGIGNTLYTISSVENTQTLSKNLYAQQFNLISFDIQSFYELYMQQYNYLTPNMQEQCNNLINTFSTAINSYNEAYQQLFNTTDTIDTYTLCSARLGLFTNNISNYNETDYCIENKIINPRYVEEGTYEVPSNNNTI